MTVIYLIVMYVMTLVVGVDEMFTDANVPWWFAIGAVTTLVDWITSHPERP